jgi:hypothetical protein
MDCKNCDTPRPPMAAQPRMTTARLAELRQKHRPYQATAGELCLACSLPNIPGDFKAPVVTFYPCLIVRLLEYADRDQSILETDRER